MKISRDRSIYSESEHNPAIDCLLNGATSSMKLEDKLNDDSTAQEYLDMLFSLAKGDHQESIELLLNLALSEGEVASYAQDLLCTLIAREKDDISYKAACSVRSGSQVLATQFSSSLITDEILDTHPKLLLFAASKITGDEGKADTIPSLLVKSKIQSFDSKPIKPQWWLDTKLEDGQFATPNPAVVKDKDYLVEKIILPDDGACQFRAAFALKHKTKHWLTADKAEILNEIEKPTNCYDSMIKKSISDALTQIIGTGFKLPHTFESAFNEQDFEDTIYNKTIKSRDFTLYSPSGIESAIDKSASTKQESKFLELFTDIVGQNLAASLEIPLSSQNSQGYALPTGNHYNLIVPIDYLK